MIASAQFFPIQLLRSRCEWSKKFFAMKNPISVKGANTWFIQDTWMTALFDVIMEKGKLQAFSRWTALHSRTEWVNWLACIRNTDFTTTTTTKYEILFFVRWCADWPLENEMKMENQGAVMNSHPALNATIIDRMAFASLLLEITSDKRWNFVYFCCTGSFLFSLALSTRAVFCMNHAHTSSLFSRHREKSDFTPIKCP